MTIFLPFFFALRSSFSVSFVLRMVGWLVRRILYIEQRQWLWEKWQHHQHHPASQATAPVSVAMTVAIQQLYICIGIISTGNGKTVEMKRSHWWTKENWEDFFAYTGLSVERWFAGVRVIQMLWQCHQMNTICFSVFFSSCLRFRPRMMLCCCLCDVFFFCSCCCCCFRFGA